MIEKNNETIEMNFLNKFFPLNPEIFISMSVHPSGLCFLSRPLFVPNHKTSIFLAAHSLINSIMGNI